MSQHSHTCDKLLQSGETLQQVSLDEGQPYREEVFSGCFVKEDERIPRTRHVLIKILLWLSV